MARENLNLPIVNPPIIHVDCEGTDSDGLGPVNITVMLQNVTDMKLLDQVLAVPENDNSIIEGIFTEIDEYATDGRDAESTRKFLMPILLDRSKWEIKDAPSWNAQLGVHASLEAQLEALEGYEEPEDEEGSETGEDEESDPEERARRAHEDDNGDEG